MEPPFPPDQEPRDESLAKLPPTPVTDQQVATAAGFVKGLALISTVGAGAILLMSSVMQPTHGATRSAKLKWQLRQLEIEQAQRDAESNSDERP